MARTLLISDLHLAPERPLVTAALAEFLQREAHCDTLYILGDLFEVWVGDDDDAPLAQTVAEMLRSFTDTGSALYLMQGNRDFLLGEGFCNAVGGELLQDPTVHTINGTPTLLMHGDSLCTDDVAYQAFREQARSAEWQGAILAQSLEERRKLARNLRNVSQEANSNKAEDIMDVAPEAVAQAFEAHGVSRLIHGHTHRPCIHRGQGRARWVLGDWEAKGWYIELSDDKESLETFFISGS